MDARLCLLPRGPGAALAAARRCVLLLLALLLLWGSFDLHLGEEEHAGLGLQPEQYTLGAAHPQLPPHMERGTQAERPRCKACLAQLQTRGAQLLLAHTLPPLAAAIRLPAGDAAGAVPGPALRPQGRAPPLA